MLNLFHLQHILNEIAESCVDIARDKSGCCLFQQCITYDVGEATERIVAEIVANAFLLSEDAFGFESFDHLQSIYL